MFTRDKPASSILEVLDFVESGSPEAYLFRGQTTHYPSLMVSALRRSVIAETAANPWIEVDQHRAIHTATDRERIREDANLGRCALPEQQ